MNTYKNAGVDIDVADKTKREMAQHINGKDITGRVINKVGAYASLYNISNLGYKEPVLVLKTEEPGSKQKIALKNGNVRSICYDMINHLINDIVVMGATPLTVQDAIICGKIEEHIVPSLVKYISEACLENGCVLTGGETSEQPGVINVGDYILTSSVVGVIEKDDIVDGSKIEVGDCVLALASNGIHTNGYSFLRKMMETDENLKNEMVDGDNFLNTILIPHRSYYKIISQIAKDKNLSGMAHITGGGVQGNLNRVLPSNMDAVVELSNIKILPIFKFIKEKTSISDEEMLKVFNTGVGFVLVVKNGSQDSFINRCKQMDVDCYPIGKIVDGIKQVNYVGQLNWDI